MARIPDCRFQIPIAVSEDDADARLGGRADRIGCYAECARKSKPIDLTLTLSWLMVRSSPRHQTLPWGVSARMSSRQGIREVESSHSDPVVGHAVIDVESVGQADVVAAVDAGGKDDVGDGPAAFLRQFRGQHGFMRTIEDVARMLDGEHHHPGGVGEPAPIGCQLRRLVDSVVDDQPSEPGHDRGRAAADLEPIPGHHRGGQPVMHSKWRRW